MSLFQHNGLPCHGGDPIAAEARFGRVPWLDLSTGINPWPYPLPEKRREDWTRLPTSDWQRALGTAAAHCYGARPEVRVVVAPGTQALIQWLPYLARRRGESLRVAIVAPTYAEHAIAWSMAGHQVVNVGTLAEVATLGASVAVVVNPNNPDGHVYPPWRLCDMVRIVDLLVVDEAFADVQPQISLIPLLDPDSALEKVVVLRSFGKFFGLAGVRLGFAITGPLFAARLETALGPWAVGGAALRVGTIALSDARWIATTRTRLRTEASCLDAVLLQAGLIVTGGTDLFRLVDCGADCGAIYERLGYAGILVRAFSHRPSWLRFGLPGCATDRQRLVEVLSAR